MVRPVLDSGEAVVRRSVPNPARPLHAARVSMVQVFTLVMWMGVAVVGVLGFRMQYSRPLVTPPPPAPLQAQFLNVELTQDELPDFVPAAATPLPLPDPAQSLAQPSLEQPLQVAEPSAAIAFAVPVAGPAAQVVPLAQAGWSTKGDAVVQTAIPQVQTLTFGRGEGRQPAPEYPAVARRQGQQGPVTVKFVVGPDGRVLSAELEEPSRWPLLNEAAVRDISRKWRFSPGATRAFKVVIRYQLEG